MIAAGKELTKTELPELSEKGYDFDGWYSDMYWTTKIEEGYILEKDTTIYAKWSPRNDTPFTVEHYFYNVRNGGTSFVLRSDKTQHLTGTTGTMVNQYNYNICYNNSSTEFSNYQFIPNNSDNPYIKGDGSTVIKNYYYMSRIYDSEFEQLITILPDSKSNYPYPITFVNNPAKGYCDYSIIRSALNTNCRSLSTYYDNSLPGNRSVYNKHFNIVFDLNITQIPSEAFYDTRGINQVTLPQTCTRIGRKAFNRCDDLIYVYLSNNNGDYSKEWKYYDEYGNNPNYNGALNSLGSNPSAKVFADYLRDTTHEFRYE